MISLGAGPWSITVVCPDPLGWANENLSCAQLAERLAARLPKTVASVGSTLPERGTALEVQLLQGAMGPALQLRLFVDHLPFKTLALVPIYGRKANDVVHTAALLATEALEPLVPELTEPPAVSSMAPPLPAPVTDLPAERHRLEVVAGAGAQVLLATKRRVSPSMHYDARYGRDVWVAGVRLVTTFPVDDDSNTYSLRGALLSMGVPLGFGYRGSFWALRGAAGPVWRWVRMQYSDTQTPTKSRNHWGWGGSVLVEGYRLMGPVMVGVGAEGQRFFSYPRYLVDGQQVFNAGHSTFAAWLTAGASF